MPQDGDYLQWKSDAHAIYDDFPDGDIVPASEVHVDFTDFLRVQDSKRAMFWRYHKGKKKWVIDHYVGVKFLHYDRSLWTTFSRNQDQWLWTHEEMQIYENNK